MKSKRKSSQAVKDAAAFIDRAKAIKASWIPPELRLPSTVAEIERGRLPRMRQGELFPDGVMARLKAIKST